MLIRLDQPQDFRFWAGLTHKEGQPHGLQSIAGSQGNPTLATVSMIVPFSSPNPDLPFGNNTERETERQRETERMTYAVRPYSKWASGALLGNKTEAKRTEQL